MGLLAPGTETLREALQTNAHRGAPTAPHPCSQGQGFWREKEDRSLAGEAGRQGRCLAVALLLLLPDEVGDGRHDAADHGPVLVEADAPIMVSVQVLDELVRRLPVPRVLAAEAGVSQTVGPHTQP